MKKKIVIVAILLVFMLAGLGLLWHLNKPKTEKGEFVTKTEWEKMLSDAFGITEQGGKEVFGKEERRYRGEDLVDGRYAALTAMRMLGQSKLRIYLDTEEFVTEEQMMEIAIRQGLVEKDRLKKKLTGEECQELIALQKELYDTVFWADDYERVTLKEGVREEGKSYGTPLSVGNVVVSQEEKTGIRRAQKVTGFDTKGEPICEEATMEELFESLVISEKIEVTAEDVMRSLEIDGWQICNAVNEGYVVRKVAINSSTISSKGFSIHVKCDKDEQVIEFSNKDTGVTLQKKFTDLKEFGDIDAELEVEKLDFQAQVEYSVLKGLQFFDFSMKDTVTVKSYLGVETKTEDFKVPI